MILAHRGLWRHPAEQNGLPALRRALAEGFGIETDIRDRAGQLVISHDPPLADVPLFAELLRIYDEMAPPGMLALNVKADGLQTLLTDALSHHRIARDRSFVFDMSVPDALGYLRHGMPCFTRQSEVEPTPAFVDEAAGVWLDCFREDWIGGDVIRHHVLAGRRVALVSPELHGRDRVAAWGEWRRVFRALQREGQGEYLMICTDHPYEARTYFNAAD